MEQFFAIFLSACLVNNYVLSQFLGICSFLGVSKRVSTAKGMGYAVTFVMLLASIITFAINSLILIPLNIEYLSTLSFILVIAALVQFVEIVVRKTQPGLYRALGIFLPLITTNCAVLAVALTNVSSKYTLLESISNALGSAAGYLLAIVLLAGIRERLDKNNLMPEAFKGLPITLITAGLMSIAFLGFNGLIEVI